MNVARTATSAVADRSWIENEVWDEAFASRERRRHRRQAVPRARPAPDWFAEPGEQVRPYGVDPPADLQAPFGADPFEAEPSDRFGGTSALAAEPLRPAESARRTVHIQGRGAERNLPVSAFEGRSVALARRRRTLLDPSSGFEPDRLAMWAMFLGVALVAVAILSSSL